MTRHDKTVRLVLSAHGRSAAAQQMPAALSWGYPRSYCLFGGQPPSRPRTSMSTALPYVGKIPKARAMTTDPIREMEPTAARMVCAVAARNEPESHQILLGLSRKELMTLAVILAASVDLDQPLGYTKTDRTAAWVMRIALDVGEHLGIDHHDIYGPSRTRDIVEARQVVCWVAAALGYRVSYIGKAIDRDHSTVLHAVEKVTASPELLDVGRRVLDAINSEEAA